MQGEADQERYLCGLVLAAGLEACMKRKFEEMMGRQTCSPRPVKQLRIDKNSVYRLARPMTRAFARALEAAEEKNRRGQSQGLSQGQDEDEDESEGAIARAGAKIARWWKAVRTWRPTNQVQNDEPALEGVIRSHGKNVVCPLTQDTIPVGLCFRLFTSSGATIAYTAPDLIEYLASSGRFQCPCTREYFTRMEVERLRKLYLGVPEEKSDPEILEKAQSLPQVYDNRHSIARQLLEHENRCLAVENSCGEAMTEALDLCNDLSMSTAGASLHLQVNIIPEWEQMVRDYMRLDRSKCRTMLLSDREKMRLLAERDTTDFHGLMWIVMESVDRMIRLDDRRAQGESLGSAMMGASTLPIGSTSQNPFSFSFIPSFAAPPPPFSFSPVPPPRNAAAAGQAEDAHSRIRSLFETLGRPSPAVNRDGSAAHMPGASGSGFGFAPQQQGQQQHQQQAGTGSRGGGGDNHGPPRQPMPEVGFRSNPLGILLGAGGGTPAPTPMDIETGGDAQFAEAFSPGSSDEAALTEALIAALAPLRAQASGLGLGGGGTADGFGIGIFAPPPPPE